jgi:hypothetical protein
MFMRAVMSGNSDHRTALAPSIHSGLAGRHLTVDSLPPLGATCLLASRSGIQRPGGADRSLTVALHGQCGA